MSITLRVMGGASVAPNFSTISVQQSDTVSSVAAAISAAVKAPVELVKAAKVSPVIKGKRGDPLGPADTFGSKGVGNNDVLYVALPSKPPAPTASGAPKAVAPAPSMPTKKSLGASPATSPPGKALAPGKAPVSPRALSPTGSSASSFTTAPPARTGPPKAPPAAAVSKAKQLGAKSPPPSQAKAPPAPAAAAAGKKMPPSTTASPSPTKSMAGAAKSAPPAGSKGPKMPPAPQQRPTKATPPPRNDDDSDESNNSSSEDEKNAKQSDKGKKPMGSNGINNSFSNAFASAFMGGGGGKAKNSKAKNSDDDDDDNGSDNSDEGSDNSGGSPITSPTKSKGKKASNSDDDSDNSDSQRKPSAKMPTATSSAKKPSSQMFGGGSKGMFGKGVSDRKKRSSDSSGDDSDRKSGKGGSISSISDDDRRVKPSGSKRSRRSGDGDVKAAVDKQMKDYQRDAKERELADRKSMERELAASVEREIRVARTEMSAMWEKQREDVGKQYAQQEADRLIAIKSVTEKEAQLQDAQSKFIDALQSRHDTESKNDAQLEELFRANKDLRTELQKRREASDKKLQEMAELHSKNAILNPDTRVDNLLLIQTQIAQSLKAFNNLPSGVLNGDYMSPQRIAETTPLPAFLTTLGLERFLPTLRAQDITTSIILRMDDTELREVGIDTLGARKRILMEQQRRAQIQSSPQSSPMAILGGPAASAFVEAVEATKQHSPSPVRQQPQPLLAAGLSSPKSAGGMPPGSSHNNFDDVSHMLHIKVLKHFFKRYDVAMVERTETIVETFFGGSTSTMADVYNSLMFKHKVCQSPYHPVLASYLAERCPALVPAAHIICNLFEGREAEFAEAVEFAVVGASSSSLPDGYPSLWVQYSNPDGSVYYFSSLCGLTQLREPKRSTDMFKIRDRMFSVRYPTTKDQKSLFLKAGGASRKSPSPLSKIKETESKDPKAKKTSPTAEGTAAAAADKVTVTSANQLHNYHNYLPNPSIEDDAITYDKLYASMLAALVVRKYPTKIPNVAPMLQHNRGRERDLYHQLHEGTLLI